MTKQIIVKKGMASFLIVLILTMPIYISSAFAQNQPFETSSLPDPAQSCIAKAEEGQDLVDALDSVPIKTLEGIVSTLHFTCTAWSGTDIIIRQPLLVIGYLIDGTCKDPVSPAGQALCASAQTIHEARNSVAHVFEPLCSLQECALGNTNPGSLSPAKLIPEVKIADSNLQEVTSDFLDFSSISPYDNIYVAIGYLCPVAVLFNLRKLKTIYQTHNCCIQEACQNGISTEACDRELSEATCMYWEGSILTSLIKVLIGGISYVVTNVLLVDEFKYLEEKLNSPYVQTAIALLRAYQHLERLIDSFEFMSQTFSEPVCEDLEFDDIRDQREAESISDLQCDLFKIDLNGDGIFDRLETRCT